MYSGYLYCVFMCVSVSVCVCVMWSLWSPVCKFKAHKRCAVRSTSNCKWTTLASIGNDIIEDEEGVSDITARLPAVRGSFGHLSIE